MSTTSSMALSLVASVCEDHLPPIDFEAGDVCCMPGGRIEGHRERAFGSSRVVFIFCLA